VAFPTTPTAAASTLLSQTTSPASTTHIFPSLTTLAPAAGDLIIAICVAYEGDTSPQFSSWGASLTEILDDSTTGTGNGALGVAYKTAAGTESGTFTVTSADTWKSVQFLMRIPTGTWQGTPEVQAATRAAGAAADPGSFSPSWGAKDTLWVSVGAHTETTTTGSPPALTASPTNFSGDLIVARVADAVGDITAGVGFRQLNAASQDVGTWTTSNPTRGNGIATVIAISPAPATLTGATTDAYTLGLTTQGDRYRYLESLVMAPPTPPGWRRFRA